MKDVDIIGKKKNNKRDEAAETIGDTYRRDMNVDHSIEQTV